MPSKFGTELKLKPDFQRAGKVKEMAQKQQTVLETEVHPGIRICVRSWDLVVQADEMCFRCERSCNRGVLDTSSKPAIGGLIERFGMSKEVFQVSLAPNFVGLIE